ncbi:MAG: WD40 repeat domain-containing protein [Candidatus Poseidoniaceae archaeon]|jgi:hypothetical protein|tara:strand:+ start:2597 stop:3775 length:1179 start_codon:yes stop_codon:yes gene_type:complete
MRGHFFLGVCLLILLLPAVPAQPESLIELKLVGSLEDSDLGIHAGKMSPDGLSVLLVGENGYAHRVSALHAEDRSQDVELSTARNAALHDVSWHPRGETALITGDMGVALRYSTENHAITTVNGSGSIIGLNMTAVEWRPAGDYAYFGASDGSLWKFNEGSGMTAIADTRSSSISDIACHRSQNICVVATLNDGLAVLSTNDQLTFLSGTGGDTWVGVDCADPTLNECVGFASGLRTQAIRLDMVDASESTTRAIMQLSSLEGDFTGVSRGHDGTTLIHMAPFATIRQQPLVSEAFAQIVSEDAMAWDAVVAGRSLEVVWENAHQEGFIITSFGNIVSFEKIGVSGEDLDLLSIMVMAAVTISVPGVVLGLIYMNSPYLQRKYLQFRGLKKK